MHYWTIILIYHSFYKLYGERLPPDKFVKLTDTQKIILDMVTNQPGITQSEIVDKLKIKQQNISYNLLKLDEKGKISLNKKGKTKHYYPVL